MPTGRQWQSPPTASGTHKYFKFGQWSSICALPPSKTCKKWLSCRIARWDTSFLQFFWPVLNADDPMQPNGHRHRLSKLENKNANAPTLIRSYHFLLKELYWKADGKERKNIIMHQLHFSDSDVWLFTSTTSLDDIMHYDSAIGTRYLLHWLSLQITTRRLWNALCPAH